METTRYRSLFFVLLFVLFSAQGFANAVIKSSIVGGQDLETNDTFDLVIEVDSNTSLPPTAASLRVSFPTDKVEFVSVSGGADFGSVIPGPVEGNASVSTIDFVALALTNTEPLPTLMRVEFRVIAATVTPFTIVVSDDPGTSQNLLDINNNLIPHTFDNTGSVNIGDMSSITDAEVSTTILGNADQTNSTFDVEVDVTSNPNSLVPISTSLVVNYDTSAVTFDNATAGDLGALVVGAEEPVAGTIVKRRISSDGSAPNMLLTPSLMSLTFTTESSLPSPYSITIQPDSESTAPLLADDFLTPIPFTIDNSETTNIGSVATGSATVKTSIISGDPNVVNNEFTVAVSVEANDSGLIPIAAQMRVFYDQNSVVLLNAEGADLGSVELGPAERSANLTFRDLSTTSDFGNMDSTPGIYLLSFRTVAEPFVPFTISVESDPDSTRPLLANDFTTSIPVIYDNALTTNIPGPDQPNPEGNAVIVTDVLDDLPLTPGEEFDVKIRVGSNPTEFVPQAASLRLTYDTDAVFFVKATAADLGGVQIGNEMPGEGSEVSIDISTDGSASNSNIIPGVMKVTFRVTDFPPSLFSITAEDDPDSTAPLLADDFSTNIPHEYNTEGTTNLTTTQTNGNAIVATSILSGDPNNTGEAFTVRVAIPLNPTGLTPVSAAFRVAYETDSVELISADAGELGDVIIGDETIVGDKTIVDILTQSDLNNESLEPVVYDLNFQVREFPSTPYSIIISDDPDSSVPLLADDFSTPIPHIFFNDETTDIPINITFGGDVWVHH